MRYEHRYRRADGREKLRMREVGKLDGREGVV